MSDQASQGSQGSQGLQASQGIQASQVPENANQEPVDQTLDAIGSLFGLGPTPDGFAEGEPTLTAYVSFFAFLVTIVTVLVLQVLALRHKREHGSAYMLKDSLFKHKDLVYTEEGMKYIELQKKVASYGMLLIVAILLIGNVLGQ